MDLEAFELVLLRRPPDAPIYDEATLDQIQRAHLAFHASLRKQEIVVTNGPVVEQTDDSFRGITIYRTGSMEEARRIAEQDPAVVAGRLAVEVVTWWCPPGTMIRPGKQVSIPDE